MDRSQLKYDNSALTDYVRDSQRQPRTERIYGTFDPQTVTDALRYTVTDRVRIEPQDNFFCKQSY